MTSIYAPFAKAMIASLFTDQELDDAREDGKRCGEQGLPRDANPYELGEENDAWKAWDNGWKDGAHKNKSDFVTHIDNPNE